VLATLALGVLLGSYLYDQNRRDLIVPGITVGGIDVGGLRAAAAKVRLRDALRAARARRITVRYRGTRFTLTAGQARLTANVDGGVGAAVQASRGGWFLSRTVRGLFGVHVKEQIAMPMTYSHRAVARFVRRIEHAVDRPAREASVSVGGAGQLVTVPSERGVRLAEARLRAEVEQTLQAPTPAQSIDAPVRELKPRVTTATLAAEYPAYIIIDRPGFMLRLYDHLRLTHTYPIAVGRAGLETPPGLHHILDKQVNPAWHVPHSSWAGSLAGKVIPPGPDDPLVARWMAIDDLGDGIHGTNEPGSIGSAASHGCIRMLVPDVIQLYGLTPLGTPVYVL
jgi:lipoprotein-anchoring transpeptidase ErfK/SrfK